MPFEPKLSVKSDGIDCILRSGQSAAWTFDGSALDPTADHRLYFTCENRMHYLRKDEVMIGRTYHQIDDALDIVHARRCQYCVDLSCDAPNPWPKRLLHELSWPPREGLYPLWGDTGEWSFGVLAQAEDLTVPPGGFLRMRLERWDRRPGTGNPTAPAPDDVFLLDIPEGSYDQTHLTRRVRIPETTACVLVTVEGQGYQGHIYLEEPELMAANGRNILPDFVPAVESTPSYIHFYWMGQNLSRREWPEFEIALNGQLIHSGEVFLSMHRYASVELELPRGAVSSGQNELQICFTSEYHDTVPVAIRDISILEKPAALFRIVSCPEIVRRGEYVPVLLETDRPGVELCFESEDFEMLSPAELSDQGLNVVLLRPTRFKNRAHFTLRCGGVTGAAEVVQMVEQAGDEILCGSGDMIYVNNESVSAVRDYLEWYFHNHMGNLITIRPRYHWSCNRTLNPEVWKLFTRIVSQMRTYYPHMVDGDELPAVAGNPPVQMLAGPYFQGRQEHERDGQLLYWSFPNLDNPSGPREFLDLTCRLDRETPETLYSLFRADNQVMVKGQPTLLRDVECQADMKDACEHMMRALRVIRRDTLRHTGPAVTFKYFYEAGFAWLGAETMYGSLEPLMAFLRGASKAYGKDRMGVHLALQWSSYPHDTPRRFRRYLLSLLLPYLHGATDFNTEEGWIHMEMGYDSFDRFSDACRQTGAQEQRFFRYVRSHARTGRFFTPIAFLHGRYDGWSGVAGNRVFGMPHMHVAEPEASWALLKLFYPLCHVSPTGLFGVRSRDFPTEQDAQTPRGFFSGTPHGNVDVIPIENGAFSEYSVLCFAGYNAAEPTDLDRLLTFIRAGGTLVGCWPHFASTTDRADILEGDFRYLEHPLTALLSDGAPRFRQAHRNDMPIRICENPPKQAQVLLRTDEGDPLACEIPAGAGRIVLLNAASYPGNEAIRPDYERLILSLQEQLAACADTQIFCGDDVEYSVFRQSDGTLHYYLTPVDWYRDPEPLRKADFRMGDETYILRLPFGSITKLITTGRAAAWSSAKNLDLLSIEGERVRVQGRGQAELHILANGTARSYRLDFDAQNVQTIPL